MPGLCHQNPISKGFSLGKAMVFPHLVPYVSLTVPGHQEMYADVDARGGILEPPGIVEVKYRAHQQVLGRNVQKNIVI